jgi:hypothetical protein
MKHMAHLATAMHRVLAISPTFDHSLIGSVLSSGQETSSSTISTHMTGRLISNSGMLYEIAVRAAHGDEDVMASYLPMVINQSVNQWLLSLREGSINT